MIDLMGVPLRQGNAIILTRTIGGATSNVHNPQHTDIYTDAFPDGLTIAVQIDEFYDIWIGHLLADIDFEEVTGDESNVH